MVVQIESSAKAVLRLLGVLFAVVLVTVLVFFLGVNSATAGFIFLVFILALATRAKLSEAVAASFLSVAAYNFFFLPPVGTFTISDPQNWVALLAFLVTAITASQLSARALRRAQEARERQEELERMYRFSRALMMGEDGLSFSQQVLKQVFQCFGVKEACFYDRAAGSLSASPQEASSFDGSTVRTVAERGNKWQDASGKALILPLKLGSASLGSLGIAGDAIPSEVAMNSIAQLLAIAVERTRAQQTALRLEAREESERLKATLLDALAHEFKTPLTSVKAATTTLLTSPLDPADQRELVTIMDEEADRMTRLVSDSIELARIGSAPIALKREPQSVPTIIASVKDNLRGLLENRSLNVSCPLDLPFVDVDGAMTELALRQILNNALKYSPPGSDIAIDCRLEGGFVLVTVSDSGPGISEEEGSRIFEKFYRGSEVSRRVPGTGLGLSITREIIESQGGAVLLKSKVGAGASFTLTLPVSSDPQRKEPDQTIDKGQDSDR